MRIHRKKLNLSVKKEFQRWLIVRIFGAVLLSSLVAGAILYLYARHEVMESFWQAHITIRRVSDLLWPVVLAGSAVSLISGTLLAIFLPQKIAGPIFHMERDLEKVAKGDLTVHITLRSDDTLKDLAASINQTVSALRVRIKRIQDGYIEFEKTEEGRAISGNQKLACSELKSFKT